MICSDWEGPWVIADHAYEVTKAGIPNGDKLFAGISEYDDYLAYVRRKKNYEPGDTLGLIAPFLIAYGVDEKFLIDVSQSNASFIAGAPQAVELLKNTGCTLKIVSTSYCQYVHYTTSLVGIAKEDTRCTLFPIDEYSQEISEEDKEYVRRSSRDASILPKLGITASTRISDLSHEVLSTIKKLDTFFWKDLPKTTFREIFDRIKPLGGRRKFDAVKELIAEEGKTLQESIVIGDSITDWVMLKETKEAGGLAVAFNGNDYAIRNANLAILSDNCVIIPLVADLFERCGIDRFEKIARNWNTETVRRLVRSNNINPLIYERYMDYLNSSQTAPPQVVWITKENTDATIEKSKAVRKTVRGVAVGSLG